MREIKFRAWDKTLKKWHTDFFTVEIDFSEVRIYESGFGWISLTKEQYQERFEIVQYTGLKDKNGKEIFEGDIIQWGSDERMKYKVDMSVIGFFKSLTDFAWDYDLVDDKLLERSNEFEIIGNIYENSELLN